MSGAESIYTPATYKSTSRRDIWQHPIKFMEIGQHPVYFSPHFPCNLISEKIVEEFDLTVRSTTPREIYSDFTKKLTVSRAVVLTPLFKVDDAYLGPSASFYIVPANKIPGSNILFGSGYGRYCMRFTTKGVSFDKEACKPYEMSEETMANRVRYFIGQSKT
jgi:hypothetical protein